MMGHQSSTLDCALNVGAIRRGLGPGDLSTQGTVAAEQIRVIVALGGRPLRVQFQTKSSGWLLDKPVKERTNHFCNRLRTHLMGVGNDLFNLLMTRSRGSV